MRDKAGGEVSRTVSNGNERFPRVPGLFTKAGVQPVLHDGCKTWVVAEATLRALAGFHHRAARRLSGPRPALPDTSGSMRVYPPIDDSPEDDDAFKKEQRLQMGGEGVIALKNKERERSFS